MANGTRTDKEIVKDPQSEHSKRIATQQSKPVIDWDKTDPATGLTIGCKTACEIIDHLDYRELLLFNAPRKDNPHITAGQLVEEFLLRKGIKAKIDDVVSGRYRGSEHQGKGGEEEKVSRKQPLMLEKKRRV